MLFNDNRILFFDNYNIESMENVKLTLNPAVKSGPCILIEKDWEMERARPSGIVFWDGKYRMYYRTTIENGRVVLAYVTSKDGITWERPELGVVDYKGSKANNLVDVENEKPGEHCVFIDPIGPDEHRFKLVMNDGKGGGMALMTSADGIRFKRAEGYLLQFFTDNHMTAFYDTRVGKYRVYTRGWEKARIPSAMGCSRTVVLAEADDLFRMMPYDADAPDQHASGEPQKSADGTVYPYLRKINKELPTALRCDDLDAAATDLYQAALVQYLPDVYFSFPSIYYNYPWPPEGFVNDGVLDLQFASSRDGLCFNRGLRESYVRMDLPDGPATKQMHMLVGMIPNGDKLSQYYIGMRNTHGEGRITVQTQVDRTVYVGYPMVLRLEQRMDGFVSADSAYTGGVLTTRPFAIESDSIKLNIDTSASGAAYAALLDEAGRAIPGYSMDESDRIQGNNTQYVLSWNKGQNDVSKLKGRSVRLVLKSRCSKLFAIYP